MRLFILLKSHDGASESPYPATREPGSSQAPSVRLFRRLRVFRRQHKGIGKIVNVFIHHEGGDCIVKRLLESCGRSFAVNTARNRLVLCKGIHRPLMVTVEF